MVNKFFPQCKRAGLHPCKRCIHEKECKACTQ